MQKNYFIYIVTDKPYGTLYIGVTSDLTRRIYEHREGLLKGFTKKYGLKKLVCYEVYPTPSEAIAREKVLKKWKRQWKIDLIQVMNPTWRDLYGDIIM